MSSIHFCGYGWVPIGGFLCLSLRETDTKGLHGRFPTRPEEDDGRQGPRAVITNRGKASVRERQLLSEEQGPVNSDAGLANVRGWISVPGGCAGISLGYTLVIVHRKATESVKNFSLLALGANPRPCLFFFFSSTHSVVYIMSFVFVKQCEIPLAGDERNP